MNIAMMNIFSFLENYSVSVVVGSEEQNSSLTLTHTPALTSKGKTKHVVVSVSLTASCYYA